MRAAIPKPVTRISIPLWCATLGRLWGGRGEVAAATTTFPLPIRFDGRLRRGCRMFSPHAHLDVQTASSRLHSTLSLSLLLLRLIDLVKRLKEHGDEG